MAARTTVIYTSFVRVFRDEELHKDIVRAESGKLFRDHDDAGKKFVAERKDSANHMGDDLQDRERKAALLEFQPCVNTFMALGDPRVSKYPDEVMAIADADAQAAAKLAFRDAAGAAEAGDVDSIPKDKNPPPFYASPGNKWNGSGCGPTASNTTRKMDTDAHPSDLRRQESYTIAGKDALPSQLAHHDIS